LRIDTGGQRNEKPLTHIQLRDAIEYAEYLGMPKSNILYRDYLPTGYVPSEDGLIVGTDVYPIQDPISENGKLSFRAAIAHEIVGHREACLQGWTQPKGRLRSGTIMEDVQASIRAARFAPGLSNSERIQLIKDAIERLPEGVSIRNIRNELNIALR